MAEILRSAEEWAAHYGTRILDPDGWREDDTPLETPISDEEFRRRWAYSTVLPLIPALPELP